MTCFIISGFHGLFLSFTVDLFLLFVHMIRDNKDSFILIYDFIFNVVHVLDRCNRQLYFLFGAARKK